MSDIHVLLQFSTAQESTNANISEASPLLSTPAPDGKQSTLHQLDLNFVTTMLHSSGNHLNMDQVVPMTGFQPSEAMGVFTQS